MIDVNNLTQAVIDRLFPAAGQSSKVALRSGVKAVAVLYLGANIVEGDLVVIGDDTFEFDVINTDSGVNIANVDSAALDATSDPVLVTTSAAPGTAISAGDLLRIENEMLKVLRKISTTQYVCGRARCGTAIATHAKNTDIFVSATPPAAHIPVGLVTTLTPAVAGPALVDEFNNAASALGHERATAKASTEYANYTAYAIELGAQVVFIANEAGADATATTSTFSAVTDNLFGAATFKGGADAGVRLSDVAVHTVTASEELDGQVHFAFPFTVRAVGKPSVREVNGVEKSFTGQVKIDYAESSEPILPATTVTLRNTGAASTAYATGFVATDVITLEAFE